jgi:hypothetical protein
MKLNFFLVVFVTLLTINSVSYAQTSNDPKIKILPSDRADVLKVLFVSEINEPVIVTFYRGAEVLGSDKIKGNRYSRGFLKKYDISKIKAKEFTIEVASAHQSATYKIIPSKSTKTFVAQLEQLATNTEFLVKRND